MDTGLRSSEEISIYKRLEGKGIEGRAWRKGKKEVNTES